MSQLANEIDLFIQKRFENQVGTQESTEENTLKEERSNPIKCMNKLKDGPMKKYMSTLINKEYLSLK